MMPLNPMMFVSDAPQMGPIRGIGSGLIEGANAVHGRQQDSVRNSLADRNTKVQEAYLQRTLSNDSAEAAAGRSAQVETLVAEFRDASRRGDANAMRAARDKLERAGISVSEVSETTVTPPDPYDLSPDLESKPLETADPHVYDSSIEGMLVENTPQEQADSRALSGMLEPAPPAPEMDVAGLDVLRSVMPDQEQSAPEPTKSTSATGYRLTDKATGQALGDVGLEGDVDIGAGNVGKVFQPFIQNARSGEHRKAAETAQSAAQAMVPILGEDKAIEYGQKIYETEAGRIDKITAGRGIGGTAGAGTMSGFGKTDFQQTDTGDDFAHRAAQDALSKVAGGAKSMGMLRDFNSALALLQSTEGMSQQQAKATLLRAQSGLTVNKAEMERMEFGSGLVERIGNAIKMIDNGTLTQDYIRELGNAVAALRDGLVSQLRGAGETARNSVMAAAQFADPVERAGRAAFAYKTVTGDFGPYAGDAAAWEKARPQVHKTKGGVVAKKGDGAPAEAKGDRLSRLRGMATKK